MHSADPSREPVRLPPAFLERMREDLKALPPDTFSSFLSSYEEVPSHALRLNTLRGTDPGSLPFPLTSPVPWESSGWYYEDSDAVRPGKHILHEAGAYYIQEPSAMLPAQRLPLNDKQAGQGLRILDLCAAPGGKSIQLAMRMQGQGLLVSNEIHPDRARILSQNIERMGITNVLVTNETPEHLAERFPAFFHRILVDAPCSGEGMFRKNPAAIDEWSPQAVEKCAERQRGILEKAAQMLAPGGVLVYSTCTFAPAEDEDMTVWFLKEHPSFSLLEQKKYLPHEIRGEGHFCAVLKDHAPSPVFDKPERTLFSPGGIEIQKKAHTGQKRTHRETELSPTQFSAWLSSVVRSPETLGYEEDRILLFGDHVYLVPEGSPDPKGLKILRPGLHLADIAERRGQTEFIPAHALSHALSPQSAVYTKELTDAEAAAFLNGQSLRSADEFPGQNRPWCLMTFSGHPLGWARYAGGQFKNHYPKGLRISL